MNAKPIVVWLILNAVLALVVTSLMGFADVVGDARFVETIAGILIFMSIIAEVAITGFTLIPMFFRWMEDGK